MSLICLGETADGKFRIHSTNDNDTRDIERDRLYAVLKSGHKVAGCCIMGGDDGGDVMFDIEEFMREADSELLMKNFAVLAELTLELSDANAAYEAGRPGMSDKEYDALYDRLQEMERNIGVAFISSVTQNVGYEVVSLLQKERHSVPMLSLDKTKDIEKLKEWLWDKKGILSLKMDGLTVVLTYRNGRLLKAVTRGNGEVGEVVTHNAKWFDGVPNNIKHKGELVLRGEAVITYSEFERINSIGASGDDGDYKNPRNLCSGTVRQLDSRVSATRKVRFICFSAVSGTEGVDGCSTKEGELDYLNSLGFNTVLRLKVDAYSIDAAIKEFEESVKKNDVPSDGLVLTYDDIEYGMSLGNTSKFPRHSIAFKWHDNESWTTLKDIVWQVGRTGIVTPVAVFEPLCIEGSRVERATLHNVSMMQKLLGQPYVGQKISVYKANMIIPNIAEGVMIEDAIAEGGSNCHMSDFEMIGVPLYCPVCGYVLKSVYEQNSDTVTLVCYNQNCGGKQINRLKHFVKRDAMNINGISEAILNDMTQFGFIGNSLGDIYRIEESDFNIWERCDGYGYDSVKKIKEAINASRKVSLANLVYAYGVRNVGLQTAKILCKEAGYDFYVLMSHKFADKISSIHGLGEVVQSSWREFIDSCDADDMKDIVINELNIEKPICGSSQFSNIVFCCTGALYKYNSRKDLQDSIEARGGKLTNSVTSRTNYLITNDTTSGSSKNKDAFRYGIEIITEEQFIDKFGK